MLSRENLETNLARVHEWIKVADEKVSIFLAFQGIAVTLILPYILEWCKSDFFFISLSTKTINGLIVVGMISLAYSILNSIYAVLPKVKKDNTHTSFTYFADIAKHSFNEYIERMEITSEQQYRKELLSQTYISAKIATQKHSEFREAVIYFFVGLFLLIITFFLAKLEYGF